MSTVRKAQTTRNYAAGVCYNLAMAAGETEKEIRNCAGFQRDLNLHRVPSVPTAAGHLKARNSPITQS